MKRLSATRRSATCALSVPPVIASARSGVKRSATAVARRNSRVSSDCRRSTSARRYSDAGRSSNASGWSGAAPSSRRARCGSMKSRSPAAQPSVRASRVVNAYGSRAAPRPSRSSRASAGVKARSRARSSVSSPLARRRCNGSIGSWRVASTSRSDAGAARQQLVERRRDLEALHGVEVVDHGDDRLLELREPVEELQHEAGRRARARRRDPPERRARRHDPLDRRQPLRPERRLTQAAARREPRDVRRLDGEPRREQRRLAEAGRAPRRASAAHESPRSSVRLVVLGGRAAWAEMEQRGPLPRRTETPGGGWFGAPGLLLSVVFRHPSPGGAREASGFTTFLCG